MAKVKPRRRTTVTAERPFEPFSAGVARRARQRAGDWPSEQVTPQLNAEIARGLAGLLGYNSQRDIEDTLDRLLRRPPTNRFLILTLNQKSDAEIIYDYLDRHHNDVVEAVLCGLLQPGPRAEAAEMVNQTWRHMGYAFRLTLRNGRYQTSPTRSKHLDDDLVDEAFTLLDHHQFAGPLGEFEKALNFLGKDDDNACVEANNAFESTMKAIWSKLEPAAEVDQVASKLIAKMAELKLLPVLKKVDQMATVMQLLPSLRNQAGTGHGGGIAAKDVERHVAELTVHLAASFIVFLIRQYDAKHGAVSP